MRPLFWRPCLGLLLSLLFGAGLGLVAMKGWAAFPERVRVRLFEAYPQARRFQVDGAIQVLEPTRAIPLLRSPFLLESQGGRLVARCGHRQVLCYQGSRLTLAAADSQGLRLTAWVGSRWLPQRRYTGTLTVQSQGGALRLLNTVSARHYVAVVISSETPPGWPLEALKAQAVLTQTRLQRYRLGDLLGDSTQQEAYLGEAYLKPQALLAVAGVWGQVLREQGQPMVPYYHASCAGRTSDPAFFSGAVTNGHASGGKPCPYCRLAPFSKPTVSTLSAAQWRGIFPQGTARVLSMDASGRPLQVAVGRQRLSGYQFWLRVGQAWGWDKLPGTRFQLQCLPDGQVRLRSTGAGHGVGLCQWGAAAMARQGYTYRQILQYYFPLASLHGSGLALKTL